MYKRYLFNKGFVLIASLLATSIIVTIAMPYISRVATEYKLMTKIYNAARALDLAEAGIDRACWEISCNNGSFNGWVVNGQTRSISVSSFTNSTGQIIGDYDTNVVISADGLSATITSIGYAPNKTLFDERRTVKVVYEKRNFSKAIAALNGISMSGQAFTDSYDSNLGSYNALLPDGSHNVSQHGDIMTNGSITLTSQTFVNGDANPGPDHPFPSPPTNVSGSYGTLEAPFTVDPIPVSMFTLYSNPANNSNESGILHDEDDEPVVDNALTLSSSDSITLTGGVYYFTSINSNGLINVIGSSTIYVDGGDIKLAGQGIVNNAQPRNLLIYSSGGMINISGGSSLSGAIYAPNATVKLSGHDNVFGSITCGVNVDVGQAAVHFDMDLLDEAPVFASSRVTSWQDIA